MDTMDMANYGWSVEPNTYTKICQPDYPNYFINLGDLYDDKTYIYTSLYGEDKWVLYCDGHAKALAASIAAVAAIFVSLN